MSGTELRQDLARTAARLMCEHGILDYALAKNKALATLGVQGRRASVPTNQEVSLWIADYLRIYDADAWGARLRRMREMAVQAFKLCKPFAPRAVGAVVNGLAMHGSPVQLHVFCAYDEMMDLHLGESHIPFDAEERRVRHPDGREMRRPACVFMADDLPIELLIFAEDEQRWSPLSPIDGKPMPRWSLRDLETALQVENQAQ